MICNQMSMWSCYQQEIHVQRIVYYYGILCNFHFTQTCQNQYRYNFSLITNWPMLQVFCAENMNGAVPAE